jgi:hypothetical protein
MTMRVYGHSVDVEPLSRSNVTAFKDADAHRQMPDNFLIRIFPHDNDRNPVACGISAVGLEGSPCDCTAMIFSRNRVAFLVVASTNPRYSGWQRRGC